MSRRPRNADAATPVEATKHHDTRVNIPTGELRDFVAADEAAPGTVRYPRDPSLDPQLLWRGKDEQDGHDLAVRSYGIRFGSNWQVSTRKRDDKDGKDTDLTR